MEGPTSRHGGPQGLLGKMKIDLAGSRMLLGFRDLGVDL